MTSSWLTRLAVRAALAGLAALPLAPAADAQPKRPAPARPPDRLERLAQDVVRATTEYRGSLLRLLAIYERDLAVAEELVTLRRDLHARGIATGAELDEAERAYAALQGSVIETRQWIAEADHLITEATVAETLARLAPLRPGGYEETPTLVRFNGIGPWSLAMVGALQRFFAERFGRGLPISAMGQSAVHDRIGFDHRNAVDVALHPDSPEGRSFIDHLRASGIPFVAFRGAIPGSATGAHIHVGPPSPRFRAR